MEVFLSIFFSVFSRHLKNDAWEQPGRACETQSYQPPLKFSTENCNAGFAPNPKCIFPNLTPKAHLCWLKGETPQWGPKWVTAQSPFLGVASEKDPCAGPGIAMCGPAAVTTPDVGPLLYIKHHLGQLLWQIHM